MKLEGVIGSVLVNTGKFLIYSSENCPRRPLECSRLYQYFLRNGWAPADRIPDADLIIVYTCGGFTAQEVFSINTIQNLEKRKHKNARLLVTGCLTKINRQALGPDYEIIFPEDLDNLDTLIQAKIALKDIPESNTLEKIAGIESASLVGKVKKNFRFKPSDIMRGIRLLSRRFRNRYKKEPRFFIKIAEGCEGHCSFCAIKFVGGELCSKPLLSILLEFEKGLAQGYKKIVLGAGDTGCYGLDHNISILHLLKEIFKYDQDFELIIQDFNPKWLVKYADDLIPLLKKNSGRISDLLIPIQTGSDRILRLMRRQYRIDEVKQCLRDLRSQVPQLSIRTHIMVGFPGETEQDFLQTQELLAEFKFEDISIFPYEDRPGIGAASLSDKITESEKRRRRKKLYKFSRIIDPL